MSHTDLQTYHSECEALAFGRIGADDCPPAAYVAAVGRARARKARRADKARRARLRASDRREPGNRTIRKVLRRAQRNGVRSRPTFRAYVAHAFGTMPGPDRLARLLDEVAPRIPGHAPRGAARSDWAPSSVSGPDVDGVPADWAEALAAVEHVDGAA